jgi:hypothetical protein
MPAVAACVICGKPLDDGRRRRADAVTCSPSHRTLLWRARRKIRRDGGLPYVHVNTDGYGSVERFDPPPSPATSMSDARFRAQLDQLEQAQRPVTDEERRERSRLRDVMRRNPGVLIKPLHDRLIDNTRKAQALEEAETTRARPLKVEDRLDPEHDPDVIARRGQASRNANRHIPADPNSYVDKPYTSLPPGPPQRYPRAAPENSMIDAPWGRNTPRRLLGG